ncbi:MAG: phosphoribosylaminoimidazolesuccinocarboxamide synthase [bacterium]|nr:phosphoribosylaminoimidazolesuccinocarboxamide synthase [bacterium]
MKPAITSIEIPGVEPSQRGKVRDIFDLGGELLIVATDRISAFDCILPQGVPGKGAILTQMTRFWLDALEEAQPNHLVTMEVSEFPEPFRSHPEILEKRSMLVRKADPILVECVVRGYLAGSGWVDYQKNRTVAGVKIHEDITESGELPKPMFTPAVKNKAGHDENISFDEMLVVVGGAEGVELRDRSIELYKEAAAIARERGVIIADTKFEFGYLDGEIVLIDEVLTPDSSRFWRVEDYQPGRPQEAMDKQFVRDYLKSLDWDRNPPAPDLPEEIIMKTRQRYLDAYTTLTGKEWED